MISRMAKPEEVLIVEDENGEIVRETTKDTDTIALYISMKETIWCLCLFDPVDTMNIMLEKLSLQLNGTEWSWHNINTLCWAIGSSKFV
jgi:exportin-1